FLRRRPKKAIVQALFMASMFCVPPAQRSFAQVTSLRFFRPATAVALTLVFIAAPAALSAQAPTPQELSRISAAGSYLAARHAGQQRDAKTAAAYYRQTLRYDPKNGELLDRTFLSLLVGGEVGDAVQYADRILQADKND